MIDSPHLSNSVIQFQRSRSKELHSHDGILLLDLRYDTIAKYVLMSSYSSTLQTLTRTGMFILFAFVQPGAIIPQVWTRSTFDSELVLELLKLRKAAGSLEAEVELQTIAVKPDKS